MDRVQVIDSHTGGEPTRVVTSGGPDLGGGPLSARREAFRERFDRFRSAVVNEPRGSDVVVGAMLVEPHEPGCVAGVIFFNNVGVLGMCGHGTIGVAVTLAHMGKIGPGSYRLDTPVGVVGFEYRGGARVSIENVPSYRLKAGVAVDVPGVGPITGDVAWGGNWFFLTPAADLELKLGSAEGLLRRTTLIRRALEEGGVTGAGGAEIDHVELFGPPEDPANHARNYVLCPGGAYDRSPCGTGTSAKLACLAAEGKLDEGQAWRQESVIGSVFEGTYRRAEGGGRIIPTITGEAYVTAEATLLFDPADPFREGIRS
ncbi:4-hydroxyproline epimerase [Aquisphaera giovannonii]|uniref:4-hydroxyproline epimerase n=1 Tax=Aquisphaera giovannonii TaxID=406548 RepID=A0A5B9W3H2_9BACT|nr:proline racemase family protein [Aquisphaera giovannonii]QEH35138.1 4-hydroxyproline epimerase [Aquisphaera giovannonii]